jgi:ATP-dependent Clp protease ATP-binding subunit ClpC
VIATSNAGAEFIRECVKKGISGEELQNKVIEYVQKEKIFSPEFLNRFDGVVVFEPLKKETLVEIAKLMLDDFKKNLLQKNITVSFDEKVIEKIAEDGYNIEFGARPMRRIVELVLGDLIGKAIIENKIMPGDNIKITVDADKNEYIWTKI